MRLSDIKLSTKAIQELPDSGHGPEEKKTHTLPNPEEITDEQLSGAERFLYLQERVIAMLPDELFPQNAEELLLLNNLIYDNIKNIKTDVPREVIAQWEHIAPTRRKREIEIPYRYS